MQRMLVVLFLTFAAFIQVVCLEKAATAKKDLPQGEDYAVVIPSPVLKIAALEFHGFASDIFFLRTMVFMGGAHQRTEWPKIKAREWKWFADTLDNATELDPYFFDAYYYANAFLPWDAGMVQEANRLLEKGSSYRDWDWMVPYFLGFNNFFFLQNDGEAAEYLMEASRRPGGDPSLASLAARLAFKENRLETAILFLEEIAKKTENESLRNFYGKRIQAMRSIRILEKGIALYRKEYGRMPAGLDDLVKGNILKRLPVDPYGGRYFLEKDGKVISTSSGSELGPYLSPAQKKYRN